jgi:hypothetical protein
MITDRCHSKDVAGHQDETNDHNNCLHLKQTHHARHLMKREQIQPAIFCRSHFPDLKRDNVNFHHRIPQATFRAHGDNSMSCNESKFASKFEKHYISRLPHRSDSPDLGLCDFWLFEMLKGVLKDREFNSSDEIKEAITQVLDELAFDEVQSVFHN